MKKLYILLLLLLLVEATKSQDKSFAVSTTIKKVTVFTNGAQINRTGSVEIASGKTVLSFQKLSPYISKPSIQVKGEGTFTILSVNYQIDYVYAPVKQNEISELDEKRKSLVDKLTVQNTILDIYNSEETTIGKNQQFGGAYTGLKAEDLKTMLDFQRSRLTEVKMKQLELQTGIDTIEEQIKKLNEQLSTLRVNHDHPMGKILVEVSASKSLNANFTLTYVVNTAGWIPSYDLRVDDISKPMQLVYKANIQQNSGEDWNNVKLSLSSNDIATPGVRPFLYPWTISQYSYNNSYNSIMNLGYSGRLNQVEGRVTDKSNDGIIGASVIVKGTTIGTYTDEDGNFTLTLPSNYSSLVIKYLGFKTKEVQNFPSNITVQLEEDALGLEEVVVASLSIKSSKSRNYSSQAIESIPLEVEEAVHATSFTFDITNPYTILSTGKNFMVEVKSISIPAFYQYYSVPKLNENAFLTAMVTDWEDDRLLDGEMSIYLEGTYIGQSVLDLTHATDTLTISLGIDKNVQVERTRFKAFNRKSFLGNTQTDLRGWEISIRNAKSQSVSLMVQDQFPVSSEADVKVDRADAGDGEVDENTGIITWSLTLVPKQEKKISFKFSVSHPKSSSVILE